MRVLSGFQPSGSFHLGNYFGCIKPNLDFQAEADESIFIVVDLHALTTVQDPTLLKGYTEEMILDFVAMGVEPTSMLFAQSAIQGHTELAWILSTVAPMGLLERAVAYKDKVERGLPASVGLFTYPILQTADIVLYDADKVPVGKDQIQHLEIARDITIKFNNTYGDVLTVPELVVYEAVAVVPGTDGQKMSKSYGNAIPIFGEEKAVKKAIMGIQTDSKDMNDPKDPDTCVIYQIHKCFLDASEQESLAEKYRSGIPYGDAKKLLFESYMDYFGSMREARAKLSMADAEAILVSGTQRAQETADRTMERVKKAVGLV